MYIESDVYGRGDTSIFGEEASMWNSEEHLLRMQRLRKSLSWIRNRKWWWRKCLGSVPSEVDHLEEATCQGSAIVDGLNPEQVMMEEELGSSESANEACSSEYELVSLEELSEEDDDSRVRPAYTEVGALAERTNSREELQKSFEITSDTNEGFPSTPLSSYPSMVSILVLHPKEVEDTVIDQRYNSIVIRNVSDSYNNTAIGDVSDGYYVLLALNYRNDAEQNIKTQTHLERANLIPKSSQATVLRQIPFVVSTSDSPSINGMLCIFSNNTGIAEVFAATFANSDLSSMQEVPSQPLRRMDIANEEMTNDSSLYSYCGAHGRAQRMGCTTGINVCPIVTGKTTVVSLHIADDNVFEIDIAPVAYNGNTRLIFRLPEGSRRVQASNAYCGFEAAATFLFDLHSIGRGNALYIVCSPVDGSIDLLPSWTQEPEKVHGLLSSSIDEQAYIFISEREENPGESKGLPVCTNAAASVKGTKPPVTIEEYEKGSSEIQRPLTGDTCTGPSPDFLASCTRAPSIEDCEKEESSIDLEEDVARRRARGTQELWLLGDGEFALTSSDEEKPQVFDEIRSVTEPRIESAGNLGDEPPVSTVTVGIGIGRSESSECGPSRTSREPLLHDDWNELNDTTEGDIEIQAAKKKKRKSLVKSMWSTVAGGVGKKKKATKKVDYKAGEILPQFPTCPPRAHLSARII